MKRLFHVVALSLLLVLAGCGDDGSNAPNGGQDLGGADGMDLAGEDGGYVPADGIPGDGAFGDDAMAPADADSVDDVADLGPPEEVVFKDLAPDMTPPWVESTVPADGEMGVAMPFVVEITFTEGLHAVTVGPTTVRMFDAGGNEVTLDYAFIDEANSVLRLTPKQATFNSAPYTVRLEPMIKDVAGNLLGNNYEFTFYTEAVPTLDTYRQLAAAYAPVLYQETNPEKPQLDYLTRFDMDGNWSAADNADWAQGGSAQFESWLYYSVTETRSHFFITYAFFWPYRYAEDEGARFGNDMGGATVVVRKVNQAPVAVETYWKRDNDERSIAYLTQEASFIPDGKTWTDYKFDGQLSQADLFPNGRYVGWLSARAHESCLWVDENNGFLDGCVLNAGVKAQVAASSIEYVFAPGTPTTLTKESGKFPKVKEQVGYGLIHLLDSLWARRGDWGEDRVWTGELDYEPHESTLFKNRPDLSNPLPSFFVDPVGNDNGRPPWAWKYNPQNGSSFYNINRGVWFLDPAVHFKQRHDQENHWADYDTQSGTGWSLEYCFNPYFNLDKRGVWPECTTP